ncbi:MAG TPA: selenocysteine-specific translation elongation factor, partial [Terriglobales bacterium]
MKSVIVGTAGHIDHGKTALVKALTGIDADRLEEEKRRGITIDIGFAHLELPGADGEILRLGFVDVPGHEKFVRNMLAGVGGIDLVLLVIAADESIKPQTREHFDICRLLAVRRGITVLTKSDLVDADTLAVMRMEVEDFLRGSFLDVSRSPVISVSSLTGAGIDQLKSELAKAAADVPARDSTAFARLPIDRVFTMKGFGTVVTGTLVSGMIAREEELEVFPRGRRARVRGVQVHGQAAEKAVAGQRTALNLSGIERDELERGMTLAAPATFHPASRIDVSLSMLPAARPLKDRSRVHFHAYTSETIAEVAISGKKHLVPGQTAFAQLRLADPTLLLPSDRFIIRQFSPVITIGGGVVLDTAPMRKRAKGDEEAQLQILASDDRAAILRARITRREDRGLALADAIAETGWRGEWIEKYLAESLRAHEILRAGDVLADGSVIARLKLEIIDHLTDFHKHNPLVPGLGKQALRERLNLGPEIFELVIAALGQEKKLQVSGDLVRLPGQGVVMKDEEADSKASIEQAFATAGLKVPALRDVLA